MPKDWSSESTQDEAFAAEVQRMGNEEKAKLEAKAKDDAAALKEKFGPPLPSPEDIRERAEQLEHSNAASGEGGSSGLSDTGRRAMQNRPATFRHSDSELGGEVRTSATDRGGLYETAWAEVKGRDGTTDAVGSARFTVAEGEATLDHDHFIASNGGTEWALLREVSERATEQGAQSLRVWVRDNDPQAEQRWQLRGFQPGQRDPGAAGVYWQKPLLAEND